MAGISVDIISFPLDTIKTRLQAIIHKKVEPLNITPPKPESLMTRTLKLYSGLSSNMLISFPSAFCYFFGYESTKLLLSRLPVGVRPNENLINVFGGMGAEILANTVRTPFEVVKQQMQLGIHGGLSQTFKGIFAARGLKGFYAGYSSMLLREIPYSCIQMPIYESMKRNTRKRKGLGPKENNFTAVENAMHAMVAGGTGNLD